MCVCVYVVVVKYKEQEALLPSGPLKAEVKAMEEAFRFKEAFEFAEDVGIQDAHFERDSLVLSNAMQGQCNSLVTISNVVTRMS